jgi:O-antigen ligase
LMFVVTAFGGLLGVVAPTFEFRSPMELLLPGALAENEYVKGMIHPAAASVQSVLGYEQSRPTAPFSFSNSWGANLSMYLPFFLLAWFGRNAGWRRLAAPFVLLVAVVPTVYSLNRALWIALAVGVVYFAIRMAMLGRFLLLQLMAAGTVIAAFAFFLSPLAGIFAERLNAPHSNDRRLQLAFETIRSVATGSPILGFGSTRDVQGNFASVAGGATPDCPACAVPPLGTQGLLWMVLFSTGLVGFALFCAFFVRRFFAHWTDPSPIAIAVCCCVLFFALELPFYDTLGAPMVTLMIGLGLLARREMAEP